MKNIQTFLLGVFTLIAFVSHAQTWQLDKSHSFVNFSITHMVVSETKGGFKDFTAIVDAKQDNFSDLSTTFTIQTKSVNTDDEKRDGHLRNSDFFDVEKYPTITFVSTAFKKIENNKYKLYGKMTMKGETKEVIWDTKYMGSIKTNGKTKAGFKCTTTIKRSDFNMSWNKVLDVGGLALSDEVEITVNIELNKQ
jgi:polyisoprenoid-binding protein YceI